MVSSMRNGYAVLASLFILLFIVFLRFSRGDLKTLIYDLGNAFVNYNKLGWILFFISIFLMERRMKRLRRIHAEEMDRVSEEKRFLQEKLTGQKMSNTKKK